MFRSWIPHLRMRSRVALTLAGALLTLIPSAPVAAQGHCTEHVATLLDTTYDCVSDPSRNRFTDVHTMRWKGHDYAIIHMGNELGIYNIDDPTKPNAVSGSNFNFGTVGDSDYDLIDFDVCDDCRFAVLSHKVKRTVVFDLGVGATPAFVRSGYADFDGDARMIGGFVFSKNDQQYLVSGTGPTPCSGGSTLYTLNGLADIGFVACVKGGGSPIVVKGLTEYESDGDLYLYTEGLYGTPYVFRADGGGAALSLVEVASPVGLRARQFMLSIDRNNGLMASVDPDKMKIRIWDLTKPYAPVQKWSIFANASNVSLRSPSPGNVPTLIANRPGSPNSTRTFTIGDTGPEEFEADYWTDISLPHNDLPICAFAAGGALSPDGSTLLLSRYAVHQVYDLSGCLDPAPAAANLSVTPREVFPGETVTIRNTTTGRVDRWALWVADETGNPVAGTNVPLDTNPHEITYQVPQNVTSDKSYTAHILVESADLLPAYASCEANPNCNGAIDINRRPQATLSVDPAAVVVGESVTLTATAEGIPAANPYSWQIVQPVTGAVISRTGQTTTVALNLAGDWKFYLTVAYEHGAEGGGLYEATDKIEGFNVTSVAADFTISPPNPVHNEQVTLDGSISKPTGGDLSYAWTVEGPSHSYTGCPAAAICTIPAGSLNPSTTYSVTLKVTSNVDGAVSSTPPRPMTVVDGTIQPTISVGFTDPEIGDSVGFIIEGVTGDIDSASWSMGGVGCDGVSSNRTCTPGLYNTCKAITHSYALGGPKEVTVSVDVDGKIFDAPPMTITVAPTGSCDDGGGGGGGGVPVCTYSLSSTSTTIGAAGGEKYFTVSTLNECSWRATTIYPWITILSPTGLVSGSRTVRYRVDENTGKERYASITAAGKAFVVTQSAPYVPANFTISPDRPEIGEEFTVTVDPLLEVTRWDFGESNCAGDNPIANCLYLPSGACNTMRWSYASSGEKSIKMTLSDGRVKVKDPIVRAKGECCLVDGRPDASFTMTYAITNVSGEAMIVPVTDEIFTGEEVIFTDTSTKSAHFTKALGMTFSPPNPEIGDNVTFNLSGLDGNITKATWDFGGEGCDGPSTAVCVPYGLYVTCKSMNFTYASGGPKSVSVEVELEGGGTASAGPVSVFVANSGVCGGGGGGCSYALSSTSESFSANGGSGSFDVTTTAECGWTATTTSSSWLTIGTAAGTGSGTVNYTVDANTGTSTRSATITVENRTYRVSQAGDRGDTDPTEWLWTITRTENEDGEPVDEEVFTTTDPSTRFLFEEPGRYRVSLLAANCLGSDSMWKNVTVREMPVEDFVVGAAISMDGANETHWESDFRFHNPCGENLDVRIEYRPENTNNVGADLFFREFALIADETRIFADITEAIPGLEGEETTGSVRIESSSASGCKVLSVSRTFNDTPEGSLGLFVPALPVKRNGQKFLDVTGLIQNSNYRANLRLVNYGETDSWVSLTAFVRNGDQVGQTRSVMVRGLSTKQINEVSKWLGVDDNLAPFTVRAGVEGLEMHVLGTVVDNITGDSVLYLPSFHDEPRIWLVGVAHLEGVNESQWRTDLWLYNPTETWLGGELEYVVGDSPSDVYGFEWPILNNNRIKQYIDIVGEELGLLESRGYIVLTGVDVAPQVAARTYNLDPSGGTYGLNLQAFGSDDLLDPGETGYIAGISNSDDPIVGFRTNMGFLNTDRYGWTGLRVTMYNLDGTLAAEPYEFDIAPGKLLQFDIFKKLGLRKITMTGSVKIEVLNGGSVASYATEVDNRTQDSIFIPALTKYQGQVLN